jgi:hypothetical protein
MIKCRERRYTARSSLMGGVDYPGTPPNRDFTYSEAFPPFASEFFFEGAMVLAAQPGV